MKIAYGIDINQPVGNARGFTRASIETKKALVGTGVQVDDSASLVLHWASPVLYAPWPGRANVLYTVFESPELLGEFHEAFNHPDTAAIITPSTFCQRIFQKHTSKPVYVCPHGFDPTVFTPVDRQWSSLSVPPQPFIFLYVGAINARKGIDFVFDFWRLAEMWRLPVFRLVMKTTTDLEVEASRNIRQGLATGEYSLINEEKGGFILQQNLRAVTPGNGGSPYWLPGNLYLDTRRLSDAEMAALYQAAHCFLFPTRGEGFALTALEAAATGLPIICTNYSGQLDFLDDETAYLVKYTLGQLDNTRGLTQTMALPDPKDFTAKVKSVIENYRRAALKGKRAAQKVHAGFTWEQVGVMLRGILVDIERGMRKAA